jgi:hypothetical protein
MNTATKDYNLNHYTTKQLAEIDPNSVNAEMQKRDYKLWECSYMYHISPDRERFRADLARFERELKQRNVAAPTLTPTPATDEQPMTYPMLSQRMRYRDNSADGFVSRGVWRESISKLGKKLRGIRQDIAMKAGETQVDALETRVRELEARLVAAEKRFATVDTRLETAARHRRNLETRISGRGIVERSAHTASAEDRP